MPQVPQMFIGRSTANIESHLLTIPFEKAQEAFNNQSTGPPSKGKIVFKINGHRMVDCRSDGGCYLAMERYLGNNESEIERE